VNDKDFLSVEEVAKRLGLKEETIRTYIREGSLTAYRFGNVLRIRVDDFEKFVQERKLGEMRKSNFWKIQGITILSIPLRRVIIAVYLCFCVS
jgi:excisionase family DNA binding protein